MELEKVIENRNNEIDRILNDKDNIKKVDNKWIEQEAAFHLKSELNKYDGLFDASDIKTKDGGISYDGIVEVMKDGSSKAKDLLGRIDIQVKGTLVDKIPNGNSKFRIEIKHLENYAKNILGVLLFVVYIEKETKTKKIFYRNLLPIDLKKIFYKINEKDDKDKKISIDIYPIDSSKKMALKKVCANFLKAQSKQVNKRIMVLEPDIKIKEILVQDMRDNKGEYLKDKAYLYVKIHEDEGFIPAILGSGGKMSTVEKVNNPIILNCMINDIIADNLNQLLLSYILAYDKTKDENYYEVAMMIANKLVEFNTENHVYMINKLQLCKRKRELTKQEINILQEYKNK